MDTGRRHETLELETRDNLSLMANAIARVSAFFNWFIEPQSPQGENGARRYLHLEWLVLQEMTPELRETKSVIMGSKC